MHRDIEEEVVTSRWKYAGAIAGLCLALSAGTASARNPHCAGGIQYVVQAMADKQKGNLDDYSRQMMKAVQQLEMCSTEDPADHEAIGYLGWAYAEVDSMGPAGKAFAAAIAGLTTKGDKKKLEMVVNNRESFWATSFNKGISEINTAQGIYAQYSKAPANDAEKAQREQAGQHYQTALGNFTRALLLKPGDPRSLRNLATTHFYLGDYATADHYLTETIQADPSDTSAVAMQKSIRAERARSLTEEKKFDEAVAYYADLLKGQPNDADLLIGLGDTHFSKAGALEGDAKKAEFKLAGDAYAKAAGIRTNSSDVPFNAALSYRQAGEWALAEPMWRRAAELSPKDAVPWDELAAVLVELKKYGEAIAAAQRAVGLDAENKDRHLRLGSIYTKAGDNARSKQALMAYLALKNGQEGAAGAASGAAGNKVTEMNGKPDKILLWDADGEKYESWMYFSKGLAFHFNRGTQVEKSDWSAGLVAASASTPGSK
jgi:tetratricopeptide (TPR) repeat protein